jgi:hypothetical protein
MTAASAFAAGIAARHRVRRFAMPVRRLVFARLRLPVAPRWPRPAPPAVPRAAQLRLVLAPRVEVSVTNEAAAPAPVLQLVPAPLRLVDTRIASRQIERMVERAHTLQVRRETVPAAATAAFGHQPSAPVAAPRPVAPAPLVLHRPPVPAPLVPPEPAAPPAMPAAPAPFAMPAPFEIERLTDKVMASIDRRFIAERERRGHV